MAIALPDIDFHAIRPYGQPASRSSAFEELASILIEQEVVEWPHGVRFDRFGNPDGGREGKGVLLSGDVWAWQAKYLFEFNSSAAGQVTSSVRRVLSQKTKRNLKRYLVAMPLDMPAGDTEDRSSAYTRWTDKVSEWEFLADEKGLEVEFIFVGAHRLLTALTEPRHAGRVRYWFGADVLTPDWQGRRLEEVIAKAGRRCTRHTSTSRWTPSELSMLSAGSMRTWSDGGGFSPSFGKRDGGRGGRLRGRRRASARLFLGVRPRWMRRMLALALMIAAATADRRLLGRGSTRVAAQAVLRVDDLLREHSSTKDGYFVGDPGRCTPSPDAVARTPAWRAACPKPRRHMQRVREVLLLVGRAGVGKTHLLCDVATRRIAGGLRRSFFSVRTSTAARSCHRSAS